VYQIFVLKGLLEGTLGKIWGGLRITFRYLIRRYFHETLGTSIYVTVKWICSVFFLHALRSEMISIRQRVFFHWILQEFGVATNLLSSSIKQTGWLWTAI